MKEIVVRVGKKPRGNNFIQFEKKTNNSKELDERFILETTLFNVLVKYGSLINKTFYCDEHKILYLPTPYVEAIRGNIISLYEKSDDPIARGYMSKGNLEYILEYAKTAYSDYKIRKTALTKKAAFILFNIISKHPFTDGNKRTGIITCSSFLEQNGYSLGALPFRESVKFITDVAKGDKTERDCEKFIKKHISRLIIPQSTKKRMKEISKRAKTILKRKKKPKKN